MEQVNPRTAARTRVRPRAPLRQRLHQHRFLYLLLAPALVLVFVFQYIPYTGLIMAFQDFDIIGGGLFGSPFVGLKHFQTIVTTPEFGKAIVNTLYFSAVLLFGGMPVPIILALLFNEVGNRTFKRITQTISYMPYFISWISVVALFQTFFSFDGPFNALRSALMGPGAEPYNPLMDETMYLPIVFLSHLWKNAGWSTVIYLAAIAGIDPTLYEAAIMDGCGRWKQTLYITLPMILPTAGILLILNMGSLVSVNFEQFYGFHNLYNVGENEVINTLIYKRGLNAGQYSLATAFGLSQGIVSFLLVFASNAIAKRTSGQGIW